MASACLNGGGSASATPCACSSVSGVTASTTARSSAMRLVDERAASLRRERAEVCPPRLVRQEVLAQLHVDERRKGYRVHRQRVVPRPTLFRASLVPETGREVERFTRSQYELLELARFRRPRWTNRNYSSAAALHHRLQ